MESTSKRYTNEIIVEGALINEFNEIMTPSALQFLLKLHNQFNETRKRLLQNRVERQKRLDEGELPDFLPETKYIRESEWTVGPIPQDIQDRRVEITGPSSDRKMVINALNSGAKVFMADFEDANSPTWENTIQGQLNLRDAILGSIDFISPEGKAYKLNPTTATLFARPRGWHMGEKHVSVQGVKISASLFDFGLYFYHNVEGLMKKGTNPYFYLPKIESHLEARLWNKVFVFAQNELGVPQGTIKATVLIETILATFEADEILYELREHSAGLNCGRWDYIFSYIKKLRKIPHVLLPDRALITMAVPFMNAYSSYVIKTCHKRNIHAMGGMAAQIPIKNDSAANEEAMQKVRADKIREAGNGHDGTWVAHPALVSVAMDVFNTWMPTENQIAKKRDEVQVTAADLLAVPEGPITEAGLRTNISVAIQYIEAWLRGIGAVPIFHLMEDAATAEISRAQVWQWIRHPKGILADGRKVTLSLVTEMVEEEMTKILANPSGKGSFEGKYADAKALFIKFVSEDEFIEFITLPGYEYLT